MFSPNLILHSFTRCRLERMLMATNRRRNILLPRNCLWSSWPKRVQGRGERLNSPGLLEMLQKAHHCTSLCLQIDRVRCPNGRRDQFIDHEDDSSGGGGN